MPPHITTCPLPSASHTIHLRLPNRRHFQLAGPLPTDSDLPNNNIEEPMLGTGNAFSDIDQTLALGPQLQDPGITMSLP